MKTLKQNQYDKGDFLGPYWPAMWQIPFHLANPLKLNGRLADGCQQRHRPVYPGAFSSPQACKRQLPAVGLLPSGPEPVPAIMEPKPALRQAQTPVLYGFW